MWEELKGIDNPHLKELAGELQDVVLVSKAPATAIQQMEKVGCVISRDTFIPCITLAHQPVHSGKKQTQKVLLKQ